MIERLLNRLFDRRVIVNCERNPYLYRWYVIRKKSFALFIHKFSAIHKRAIQGRVTIHPETMAEGAEKMAR